MGNYKGINQKGLSFHVEAKKYKDKNAEKRKRLCTQRDWCVLCVFPDSP